MKKIILYLFFFILLSIITSLFYFSHFGVETKNLNSQINNTVNKFDTNLNVKIDKVHLFLNLKKFNIEAKTLNPKIIYKKKEIEIESIKTLISIKSFFLGEFALRNMFISTKSLDLKKFISLVRTIKSSPKIYILQSKIDDGYLVADIKVNFDEKGKILGNYEVDGYVKDARINLLNEYNLNDFNFLFKIKNNNYEFKKINLSINDLSFFSNKISLVKKKDYIEVLGSLRNEIIELNKNEISNLVNLYPNIPKFEKIIFSSKSNISFVINKNFNVENFSFDSKVDLKNLKYKNEKKGKYFFPEIENDIYFQDHKIEIKSKKNFFLIKGSGDVLLQKKLDNIKYSINKNSESYQILMSLILNENPFNLEFLNYKKNQSSFANINTEVYLNKNNEVHFKNLEIEENDNKIFLKNIFLDKDFKIIKIDKINLNYTDNDKRKNILKIIRKKNTYDLIGSEFNANDLVTKLLGNTDRREDLFKRDFKLNLKLDKIYLDNKNFLKNLEGSLSMVDNKVKFADIRSRFSNNEKFVFTIESENNLKTTSLFSERAEPLVKRYKFVKGYEEGVLDFYTKKKDNKSTSSLKIFNFKLKELPVLTKLLTLASLQGIADTLTGEGIRFNELEMSFTNQDNLMTINELYAIGPAISILMSGYIENDKLVSLRGTLVPATTINKTIRSIPLLGKILVGSKVGEGVFGVSFKIKGHPNDLETKVNPIKTLTPRFITRTLEKIKNN